MLPRPLFHLSRRRLLVPSHRKIQSRLLSSATPSQSSARDTASPAADTIPPPRSESSSTTPTQTPEFEHLSYHVHRTPSQELPVYHLKKGGGTLLQTLLRKIDGDRRALIQDLVPALGIEETDIKVNAVNGHVVIKGWRKKDVKKFLESKHF